MLITYSSHFRRQFKKMAPEMQARVERTLHLFTANPAHPSLQTKKMQGHKFIYEMRVSLSCRITFSRDGNVITLRYVGPHDILKKEH